MKVFLAGYNLDAEVIDELTKNQPRRDATPETLSASYARISRDPRPINELRRDARAEVEKARKSNSTIIFKMGHHSVAEHAVFNFDLIDVSRLALEEIEKFRLCSYTEKSQRYQKLEGSFLVPPEIRNSEFGIRFSEIVGRQNSFYQELIGKGIEPEDARYVTPLSTYGQVGLTINARNLELLVRRFASSELAEIRELGKTMYGLAAKIAPSILLFTAANDFDQKTYPGLRKLSRGKWERKRKVGQRCLLVDHTAQADNKLVAALLHTSSGVSYQNCLRLVKDMKKPARAAVVKKACEHMEFYDAVPREFEHISLTYDLAVSSGCFGQLKRHRMATLTSQLYETELGVTVPPKIKAAGLEKEFLAAVKLPEELYAEIKKEAPVAAQYVLTGAHRKRSLMTLNARELYHISRLREDPHAQWEILELSAEMVKLAKSVMPLTMLLAGGKDVYPEIYRRIYGVLPKVMPPEQEV
ncbi:MAG: FAD-dependent thymidylate synthase [Candidatus Saganbacteria bacterium]|nr:FAD-dependent thymidylate synthase [Candidatus Saganbacteria bacterium]